MKKNTNTPAPETPPKNGTPKGKGDANPPPNPNAGAGVSENKKKPPPYMAAKSLVELCQKTLNMPECNEALLGKALWEKKQLILDNINTFRIKNVLNNPKLLIVSRPSRIYCILLTEPRFMVGTREYFLIKVGMSQKEKGKITKKVMAEITNCEINGAKELVCEELFDLPVHYLDTRDTTLVEKIIRWKCGWPIVHKISKTEPKRNPFELPVPTEWAVTTAARIKEIREVALKAETTGQFQQEEGFRSFAIQGGLKEAEFLIMKIKDQKFEFKCYLQPKHKSEKVNAKAEADIAAK